MSRSSAARPLVDITLMTALLLSYTWLWLGSFPGDFFVCLALYFGIGVWSHWRRRETPAEIGIRADNLGRSFFFGIKLVGPVVVAVIAFGAYLGTIDPPKPVGPFQLLRSLAWGLTWATMQQYGLACVYYRRLRDLVGSHWGATLGAAGIFATLHLPNPFLVPVTFIGGIISCQIYRRAPNLFVLGLLHLLLSVSLRLSFGPDITHRMKVGPGYWRLSSKPRQARVLETPPFGPRGVTEYRDRLGARALGADSVRPEVVAVDCRPASACCPDA